MDALGDPSVTGEMVAGRYRLGDPLGNGGMAEVFDAMDERLERPVAIKLLRTELSGDPGLRRRFEIEARAAARLVHPNVVGVFDTGEAGGRPYIVMERLPGDTLADRLREGRMDEPGTRRLASEVLGALAAAHAAGILHRDVKPSNILWARDGSAKVADFGIAKGTERTLDNQTGDITATNLVIGTPAYLAPERLLGHPATPRSDLWSLGAVLYEALAGVRPFPSATALVHDPDQPEVVPLESRRPGLDPMLSTAIDRALARRPDQRFASAAEMAAAAGLSLAGVSAAAAGTELATARLESGTQGPTELMDGRTAIVGDDAVAGGPVAPPGPPPEADQRGTSSARPRSARRRARRAGRHRHRAGLAGQRGVDAWDHDHDHRALDDRGDAAEYHRRTDHDDAATDDHDHITHDDELVEHDDVVDDLDDERGPGSRRRRRPQGGQGGERRRRLRPAPSVADV